MSNIYFIIFIGIIRAILLGDTCINMRHLFLAIILSFCIPSAFAQWIKINEADYIWGPFKIYSISLYSEQGEYREGIRPLMLSLKYAKPVEGRDFAISLARSWSNLGIRLQDQDSVVDRLRKVMPNIRTDDVLSYIALENQGYFILNDQIIPEEFNQEFNDAVVAVWLDKRVEIGRKLLKDVLPNKEMDVMEEFSSQEHFEKSAEERSAELNEEFFVSEESTKIHNEKEKEIENSSVLRELPQDIETNYPEIEVLPPFDPIPFQYQR